MEQSRIDRLNVLARKAKTEPLTDAELAERAELRQEYLDAIRYSLESQLDNTYYLDENGVKHKLNKKEDPDKEA